MSNWVTITIADVKDYLVAAQVSAMEAKALGAGQANPVDAAIENTIKNIRRHIRDCASSLIDADETKIPDDFLQHGCYLVIAAAQPRLKLELTEDQRARIKEANAELIRYSECKRSVPLADTPESPAQSQTVSPAPKISTNRTRQFGRSQQDGI